MSTLSSRSSQTMADPINNNLGTSRNSIDLKESLTVTPAPELSAQREPSTKAETERPEEALSEKLEGGAQPEHVYPTGKALWSITIALILAVFLVALDRTIIATAIPVITNDFNSLGDVGWYGSAYLICACGFMPLSGKIYTFYPAKWVFLIQILIFEVGSALCGWAPNSVSFIIGRAIAGAGSSGIFTGAIVMMTDAVPLHKRSTYMGFFGAIFGISSVVGPIMGGAFTEHATWRWSFWINLPIGALAVGLISFLLHATPAAQTSLPLLTQLSKLDPLGTLLFLPSMICLILALEWGGASYSWSSGRVIALLVVFAVTFVAFVAVQLWKKENATIPPRIVAQRSIACGMYYSLCVGGAMMIFVYYLPIWFQAIQGVSATDSGIRLIPLVLSMVIATISAGICIRITGYYVPFMIVSSIITSVGAGMLTTITVDATAAFWIGYQVLYGFGLGLGMQQTSLAAQAALPRIDVPVGTSMMMFCQTLGGAVFISVGQNTFTNKLIEGLVRIDPGEGFDHTRVVHTGATELRNVIGSDMLPEVLGVYNWAISKLFFVAVGLCVASLLGALGMEWISMRKEVDEKKEKEKEKGEETV